MIWILTAFVLGLTAGFLLGYFLAAVDALHPDEKGFDPHEGGWRDGGTLT